MAKLSCASKSELVVGIVVGLSLLSSGYFDVAAVVASPSQSHFDAVPEIGHGISGDIFSPSNPFGPTGTVFRFKIKQARVRSGLLIASSHWDIEPGQSPPGQSLIERAHGWQAHPAYQDEESNNGMARGRLFCWLRDEHQYKAGYFVYDKMAEPFSPSQWEHIGANGPIAQFGDYETSLRRTNCAGCPPPLHPSNNSSWCFLNVKFH